MKVKITIIAHIFEKPPFDIPAIIDAKIRELDLVDAIEDVTIKPIKRSPTNECNSKKAGKTRRQRTA